MALILSLPMLLLLNSMLPDNTVTVEAVDGKLIQRLCQATISPSTCITCIRSQIPPNRISPRPPKNKTAAAARGRFLSDSKITDQQIIGVVVAGCGSTDVEKLSYAMYKIIGRNTTDEQHYVIEDTCLPGYERAIGTVNEIANGEIQRDMYRQASDRINGQVRPWVNACLDTLRARKLDVPPVVSSLTPVADLKFRIATQVLDAL